MELTARNFTGRVRMTVAVYRLTYRRKTSVTPTHVTALSGFTERNVVSSE